MDLLPPNYTTQQFDFRGEKQIQLYSHEPKSIATMLKSAI